MAQKCDRKRKEDLRKQGKVEHISRWMDKRRKYWNKHRTNRLAKKPRPADQLEEGNQVKMETMLNFGI